MKKTSCFLLIAAVVLLTSCNSMYSAGFRQNHGLSQKHYSTISTVKGGSKNFCHH